MSTGWTTDAFNRLRKAVWAAVEIAIIRAVLSTLVKRHRWSLSVVASYQFVWRINCATAGEECQIVQSFAGWLTHDLHAARLKDVNTDSEAVTGGSDGADGAAGASTSISALIGTLTSASCADAARPGAAAL